MELPTAAELRERRKTDLDMTQSELAEMAGVSQPLIARIEGGDVDPRLSTLRRIVNAMNEAEGAIKRAEDIMNEDLTFVSRDDSVAAAIDLMGEAGFSQLPVVDEGGTPVGLISNSDVRHYSADEVDEIPIAEAMSESIVTVGRDATLDEINDYLDHNPAIIVIEDGAMVGIITEADVATHLR
ncbi:transcriptional regulator [Halobacteriales archaeon QS_4_70_19]|nr:MAG: transcriptional regulator [Halobacteriales archaeon QS_4_70_19]